MAYEKPLPEPDEDSAPYWQGCRDHELILQYCTSCNASQFPPGPACQKCGDGSLEWRRHTGRGNLYSWIVVEHPVPREVYGDDVPYVVALVDLEDGPRMASNLVDCATEDISAGMALEVTFDDVTEEITLPKFRPARS